MCQQKGAVIAAPAYHATKSRSLAIGLAFLSGLSEPLGAWVSIVVLGLSSCLFLQSQDI
jgi:ZIP family zinc transporter